METLYHLPHGAIHEQGTKSFSRDSDEHFHSYQSQSDRILVASVDEKDPVQLFGIQERQLLKDIEGQIIDILLVLDSTSDTILSVIEMYRQFCHDSPGKAQDVNDAQFDLISFSLQEKQRDVILNRKKVETLRFKVQGTANLVRSRFLLVLGFCISDRNLFLAIQPSGTWKRKFYQTTCRRGSNRELCHTTAY